MQEYDGEVIPFSGKLKPYDGEVIPFKPSGIDTGSYNPAKDSQAASEADPNADQQVVTSARAWRGAGDGRGSANDPRRLDIKENADRIAQENFVNKRVEQLRKNNPSVSEERLRDLAAFEYNPDAKPKDSPNTIAEDFQSRVDDRVSKGYDKENAERNAAFEVGFNARQAKKPKNEDGERVQISNDSGKQNTQEFMDAARNAELQNIEDRRIKELANEAPISSALAAGLGQTAVGLANVPQAIINAPIEIANKVGGALTDGKVNVPTLPKWGFTKEAVDYLSKWMPDVANKDIDQSWKDGDFGQMVLTNLAANSPSTALSMLAMFAPPLRAAMLPMMGAMSAGQQYAQGSSAVGSVLQGGAEIVGEMLPLKAFDKMKEALEAIPPPLRPTVFNVAGQKLMKAGTSIGITGLTNAIEESATQVMQNAVDINVDNQKKSYGEGVAKAGLIGAIQGMGMSAPHVAGTLIEPGTRAGQAAVELSKALTDGDFVPLGKEDVHLANINPNLANVSPITKAPASPTDILSAPNDINEIVATAENSVDKINVGAVTYNAIASTAELIGAANGAASDIQSGVTGDGSAGTTVAPAGVEMGVGDAGSVGSAVDAGGIANTPIGADEQVATQVQTPVGVRQKSPDGWEYTLQPDGRVVVHGNAKEITSAFPGERAMPIAGGVLFGKTRSSDVLSKLGVNQSGVINGAEQPTQGAQQNVPDGSVDGRGGVGEVTGTSQPTNANVSAAWSKAKQDYAAKLASSGADEQTVNAKVADQFEDVDFDTPVPANLQERATKLREMVAAQTGVDPSTVHVIYDTKAANGFSFNSGDATHTVINFGDPELPVFGTAWHEVNHTMHRIAERDEGKGVSDTPALRYVERIDNLFNEFTTEGKAAYITEFLHKAALAKLAANTRQSLQNSGLTQEQIDAKVKAVVNKQVMKLSNDSHTLEEMQSDFLGKSMTDEKFINRMAVADPIGFGKFAPKWLSYISDLISKAKSLMGIENRSDQSRKIYEYVKDLEKAHTIVESALISLRDPVKLQENSDGTVTFKGDAESIAGALRGAGVQKMAVSKASGTVRVGKAESSYAKDLYDKGVMRSARAQNVSGGRRFVSVDEFDGGPDNTDELGAFDVDRKYAESNVDDIDLDNLIADKLDNEDMDAIQAELNPTLPKAISVTKEQMAEHKLFPERAFKFGDVVETETGLKIETPPDIDPYTVSKTGDDQYKISVGNGANQDWFDNGSVYTKNVAVNLYKAHLVRGLIHRSGYDIASAYKKGTALKIASAWLELGKARNAFKTGTKSSSDNVVQIAKDLDAFHGYAFEVSGRDIRRTELIFKDKSTGNSYRAFTHFSDAADDDGFAINTMGLKGSKVGSSVYSVVAQWAKNNGEKFYCDGYISAVNTFRRSEQAFSFAVKSGDSGVLLPGDQNRVYGFNWEPETKEDHMMNIARLALAGMRNMMEIWPDTTLPENGSHTVKYDPASGEFKNELGEKTMIGLTRLSYIPDTGKFLDQSGRDVTKGILNWIADKKNRGTGVGEATVARAVLTNNIIMGKIDVDEVDAFAKPVAYQKRQSDILTVEDAEGVAEKGYTKEQKAAALEKKFKRMRDFHNDRDALLERINKDADAGKEEAKVLRMIAHTGFRVGGGVTDGQPTYAATTLKPEHVRVDGDTIHFDFRGKSGVQQRHSITDKAIANDIRERLGRDKLWNTTDRAVRKYKDSIIDGKGYKVHDFRTWQATKSAQEVVNDLPQPDNIEDYKGGVYLALSVAATKIGDTLETTKEHYVDPQIFDGWRKSAGVKDDSGVSESFGESEAELNEAINGSQVEGDDEQAVRGAEDGEVSYSKRQTQTPEFRKWFGDSKVVDADGKPLVVYHTTNADFSEFDTTRRAIGGEGSWFSSIPAKGYGDEGESVMPVYLSLQNPKIIGERDPSDVLKNRFIEQGYDGVLMMRGGKIVTAVAFKPNQIKSVIGNSGAFDPENPDIRYSRKTIAEDKSVTRWARGIFDGKGDIRESKIISDRLPHEAMALGPGLPFGRDQIVAIDGHALQHASKHKEDGITPEMIGQIPDALRHPRMVTFQAPGQLLAMLPIRAESGSPVVVVLKKGEISAVRQTLKITRFATTYPLDNSASYIAREIKKGNRVWLPFEEVSRLRDLLAGANFPSDRNGPSQTLAPPASRGRNQAAKTYTVLSDDALVKKQAGDKDWAKAQESIEIPDNSDQLLRGVNFSRKQIIGQTDRQYTPDQLRAFDNVGFRTEKLTLKERTQALMQDVGKKYAQGIADQFMPVAEFDKKAYNLMRLSKGASGAFETLLQGGKLKLTDNVYDFDAENRGGVVDKLLIPLQGEHHDFLRWVAANRAERLLAEDRENLFTEQDIADLKTLADGSTNFDYTIQHGPMAGTVTRNRATIYKDAAKTLDEFNRNVMDMAEQSGLIDPESRAFWEHEFYVPFYRISDEDGFSGAGIKKGVVRQQAFKKLKGGTDKLNTDLLDNMLMNWAHLLDASAKNRAAVATLEAAVDMGIAVEASESTVRQMGKSINKKSGVVWAMSEGKERYFLVDDPYVLTALNGLEYAGMKGRVWDVLSAPKHWLTVGVTASPYFKIRNLIRDSVQAISVGNLSYNVPKNIYQGFKQTNPESDEHFRLLAGGGTIHFATMYEGSEAKRIQALVESGVKDFTILNDPIKVKAFYRKFIEPGITAYNELGNRGEEINRAALYNQLIKQGVSHADAALQARDLMDFSMSGSFTTIRALTQVVPFMNARIQGMYKLGRGAKENPARFAAVTGMVALASLALLAAYHDDDDWKQREEWDRNNFWWFKFGGIAFRIPKPFEVGAIGTLAERGFEWMFDKEMTNKRFMTQVKDLLADNLSMNPIPQAVKPIVDLYANKDSFTGRPIENSAMEKLDPQYRFNQNTSMFARGASTAMAKVAGSSALSPMQIDHLLRGYFGWLGAFVVSSGDLIARPINGEPVKPTPDYWKVATGGMVADKDSGQSRYVSQMYEQAKELEQAYATYHDLLKKGKQEEAKAYRVEHADQLKLYGRVEGVKKNVGALNERIRMIERSGKTADEKRDAIRKIKDQQDRQARLLVPH